MVGWWGWVVVVYGFLSVDLALVQRYGFFPAQLNPLVPDACDQLPSEGGTEKGVIFVELSAEDVTQTEAHDLLVMCMKTDRHEQAGSPSYFTITPTLFLPST